MAFMCRTIQPHTEIRVFFRYDATFMLVLYET
jgi:hypothetical protein